MWLLSCLPQWSGAASLSVGDRPRRSLVNHAKRERLRTLKVFVLDNSLRESTVGQVVGHSIEDKIEILEETRQCGFSHQIVAAFGKGRRVDDAFAGYLQENAAKLADRSFYAFSDVYQDLQDGRMVSDAIPVGLLKMKQYGLPNAIIEIDMASDVIDWEDSFPVAKALEQLARLLQWTNDNLPLSPRQERRTNFVNLRDFPVAMTTCPDRLLALVKGIARMPPSYRPAGLLQEEPLGEYFPDEVAAWSQEVRNVMDASGWPSLFQRTGALDGLLLAHVHKQWGLADAVVLDVLSAGADGIWCSVCEEGAALGHASSCVTLANLARLGNQDVVSRYRTGNLAKAARSVTKLTTNKDVWPRQVVYGPRAIETVFGFSGIAGGVDADGVDHFSLAKFLGVEDPPIRINTLSSPSLVVGRLRQCFGDCPEFTEDVAAKMLEQMRQELEHNLEFEHTSPMGIALLWHRTVGSVHPKMLNYCTESAEATRIQGVLLEEARKCFADNLEEGRTFMEYQQFYDAYLHPYFGCFTCPETRHVLDCIELDGDQRLTWQEWRFWCKLALRTYPGEVANLDDLHSVVLRSAIIPLSLKGRETEIRKGVRQRVDERKGVKWSKEEGQQKRDEM